MMETAIKEPEDKFEKLVEKLKEFPNGRVLVFMQDGKPVRIEETIRSIKL